jgi:hypothetical protein
MQNLNYASICVGATLIIATTWWVLNAKSWFRGPKFEYDGDGDDGSMEDVEGDFGEGKDAAYVAAK